MRLEPEPLTGATALRSNLALSARGLLILIYGATAVIGTTALPLSALFVAAPMVGIVAALAAGTVQVHREGPGAAPPAMVIPWVAGTALLPFGAGALSFGSPAAGVVVLACVFCAAIWRLASDLPPVPAGPAGPLGRTGPVGQAGPASGRAGQRDGSLRGNSRPAGPLLDVSWQEGDDAIVRAALRGASLDTLFTQWQLSHRELARAGRPQHGTVMLRELLLEEMHRRDPEGVDRWLAEGDARHPERYVSDDGPLAV